jgi:oligoribonuclease NrnB/cAMP/cGMP phosphodiesterase (DHH superfamily)
MDVVIYHKDCTDGMAAATLLHMVYPNAMYIPVAYGEKFERVVDAVVGKTIIIADFNFSKEVTEAIFEVAYHVTWLDHHDSAFDVVGHPSSIQCYKYEDEKRFVLLDTARCGAMLTYEWLEALGCTIDINHKVIQLVDDYDRWKFKFPSTKPLHAYLRGNTPWTFEYF